MTTCAQCLGSKQCEKEKPPTRTRGGCGRVVGAELFWWQDLIPCLQELRELAEELAQQCLKGADFNMPQNVEAVQKLVPCQDLQGEKQ